jgi:hypothetical protein
MLADHVSIDPQCDRRVSMTEPSRDDMNRHPGQQQGYGVNVPKIMQPGMRK